MDLVVRQAMAQTPERCGVKQMGSTNMLGVVVAQVWSLVLSALIAAPEHAMLTHNVIQSRTPRQIPTVPGAKISC